MALDVTVNSPKECSAAELGDFAALVLAGGEVIRDGLEGRVAKADALFFMREGARLLGIAALKKPSAGYRLSVFKKAGASVSPTHYPLELGWVFIMPSARGKKLSHRLVAAAVEHAGKIQMFATSRTDNPGMHAPLIAASFIKHGNSYASARGAHQLQLFLRNSQPE